MSESTRPMSVAWVVHQGSCHCGEVRFEVDAPARIEALDCNCSVCRRSGFLHLIVPHSRFRLLAGGEQLCEYRFGTGVAVHTFCRTCGIKPFYVPRSNPDGMDVNVRCLEPGGIEALSIEPFDGQNWEQSGASLAKLSQV